MGKKYRSRKTRGPSFYLDFDWLINYWNCEGEARKYHHTGPVSSMYCLREGLSIVAEEGLEACWLRHKTCAELLYDGLKNLGLELFVKDPKIRLPTVTGVVVPDDVDWKVVTSYLMREHRIEISGGLGGSAGKIWRIGLMGYNAQPDNVKRLLRVLGEALDFARNGKKSTEFDFPRGKKGKKSRLMHAKCLSTARSYLYPRMHRNQYKAKHFLPITGSISSLSDF